MKKEESCVRSIKENKDRQKKKDKQRIVIFDENIQRFTKDTDAPRALKSTRV